MGTGRTEKKEAVLKKMLQGKGATRQEINVCLAVRRMESGMVACGRITASDLPYLSIQFKVANTHHPFRISLDRKYRMIKKTHCEETKCVRQGVRA